MPDPIVPPHARAASGEGRLESLDGLRGLAAFIVVIHHALLTQPVFSSAYLHDGATAARGTVAWWFIWSPLHVVWAGHEAVLLFFVLSGFVLARPFLGQAARSWDGYYVKRLIRLYAPVAAAVLIGVALIATGVRARGVGGSQWLVTGHPAGFDSAAVLGDLLLVFGRTGGTSTVLWSLHWEVIFSALLPVYVWLARVGSGRARVAIASCVLTVAVGPWVDGALEFLPLFLIGALMANDVARCFPRAGSPGSVLAAVVLLVAQWWLGPWLTGIGAPGFLSDAAVRAAAAIGAALLIAATVMNAPFKRACSSRPLLWLGHRSFSLYLIHEPLIVALAFAAGRDPHLGWFLPAGVTVALVAADILYRSVERPSHRLARHFEQRFGTLAAPGTVQD